MFTQHLRDAERVDFEVSEAGRDLFRCFSHGHDHRVFINKGVVEGIDNTHIFDLRKVDLSLHFAGFKLDSNIGPDCNFT